MKKFTWVLSISLLLLAASAFKGGFGTNWKSLMAASCLSVTPAIVLYFVGQKYFIEGIVLTGLKA